jgi:(S)-ureidoglycine aminohydrolase
MIKRQGFNTVIKRAYAVLTPESHQPSVLPGWYGCRAVVLISAALGASFSQYVIGMDVGSQAEGDTDQHSWFFFVVSGVIQINGASLSKGAFVCIPPGEHYLARGVDVGTIVMVFRKGGPASEHSACVSREGREALIGDWPLPNEPRARVKTLDAATSPAGGRVSLFTYDPGATATPFVDVRSADYGILLLEGSGVCRLNEDWHVVTAGDAIWVAPHSSCWLIAAGPDPARFICCDGAPSAREAHRSHPQTLGRTTEAH